MKYRKGQTGNPKGRPRGKENVRTRLKRVVIESPELIVNEDELAQHIREASKQDWRAAAFILERRFPERWGRRDALALSGSLDLTDREAMRTLAKEILNDARKALRIHKPDR